MKRKYVIWAPLYSPDEGGCIVLHRLCHLINELGGEAYMWNIHVPPTEEYHGLDHIRHKHWKHPFLSYYRACQWQHLYTTAPGWNTPVYRSRRLMLQRCLDFADTIVVYPEIIDGNPLNGRNVVRYLLHNPGHFTGRVEYGQHELLVRFSDSFARDFVPHPTSHMAASTAKINTTPPCYHRDGQAAVRRGSAYLVRKGKDKPLVHDMAGSVCIDGMPHQQIADIFRRVRCFYTYDLITAYMRFAMLCGCPVVCIPGPDETRSTYDNGSGLHQHCQFGLDGEPVHPDKAYAWALATKRNEQEQSRRSALAFMQECQSFFG